MRVPLKWLKEYTDITLSLDEMAWKITLAGLEVSETQSIGGDWANIVVAKVVAISPHPNADRLTLATVEPGTGQETVVCGAPNLKLNDKIAFAYPGAKLIDPHTGQQFELKPAKIRGVASKGMICSEKELGISEDHTGIMVLPPDAPVGMLLSEYVGDIVLNLEVTPNRPDCLSVIGIAREVAALSKQSMHIAEVSYRETGLPVDQQVSAEIADPDLCPRYSASLISGVKISPSPNWMQQRLIACGMRPINNIVDVTNYVMLEYGQPLHAFDYQCIKGKKIAVRRAKQNETIISLDGQERKLSSDMLVIADTERAVAIAGVMGGANSEVADNTNTVLLEAANFNPKSIHYTGSSLNLPSEARMRFERSIRPELTIPALKRATQLILETAGGEAAKGLIDVYPGKKIAEPILLSTDKMAKLLGVEFSIDQITDTLTSLGFTCQKVGPSSELLVSVPCWRSDISQAVDLAEEVARIIGYDKIPVTMLSQPLPMQNPEPMLSLKKKVSHSLTGYGFQEIVTFSLTSLEFLKKLFPVSGVIQPVPLRVVNPMTAELEYLRTNLRTNLLNALVTNRRYEEGSIKLFELGKVYIPRNEDLPDERYTLCAILAGLKEKKSWKESVEPLDFFDAKGIVEGLFEHLGTEALFKESHDETLHPIKQAEITIHDNKVGVIGELHPGVAQAFEILEPVYLLEVDIKALLPFTSEHRIYKAIPRFPAVVRDIAIIVDSGITHQSIVDTIKSFPLASQTTLFDVYTGEQVPAGKKSLAYRITFQSPASTLTDKDVDKVLQQIISRLSKDFEATLRS